MPTCFRNTCLTYSSKLYLDHPHLSYVVSVGWPARLPQLTPGGGITKDKTGSHLKKFLEEGGTILALGSSTALAGQTAFIRSCFETSFP